VVYIDEKIVPVDAAMAKLAAALPTSLVSKNSGKSRPKFGKSAQTDPSSPPAGITAIDARRIPLAKAFPNFEVVSVKFSKSESVV
jgi:hypothetical protein